MFAHLIKAVSARVATLLVIPVVAGCGTVTALERAQTANPPTVATPPAATAEPTGRSIPLALEVTPAATPAVTPRARSAVTQVLGIRPVRRPAATLRPVVTRVLPPPPAAPRPPVIISRKAPATPAEPSRLGSGNWSGYIASGSFWQVGGSWAEPAVTCTTPTATVAFWVGLGGDPGYPLYQAGSGVLCQNGSPVHVLWYELLTATDRPPQIIVQRISPGDIVGVSVDLRNGSTGDVHMVDSTTGWSQDVKFTPEATALATAEWIAEATTSTSTGAVTTLADFGSVVFGACSANGGQTGLSTWPASHLSLVTMHDTSGGSATPGSVQPAGASPGGGFSVSYGQ